MNHGPSASSSKIRADLMSHLATFRASGQLVQKNIYDQAASAFDCSFATHALGIKLPVIEDCTDLVEEALEPRTVSGRVLALRFDRTNGPSNLKGPIFGGLLIKNMLQGRLSSRINCLADAGNMNSGFSLQHLCERMNLSGAYIISRYFPADMLRMLERRWFKVEVAPERTGIGVEREFYEHLLRRMRESDHKGRTLCFFHAKHGLQMAAAFGRLMKTRLSLTDGSIADLSHVNSCISSIGSGASLTWMREMMPDGDFSYVVPEHQNTPVFRKHGLSVHTHDIRLKRSGVNSSTSGRHGEFRRSGDNRIGSAILGPHFEEPNPFMQPIEDLASTLAIYDEDTWVQFASRLRDLGANVGNSSAVNLMCAAHFASLGQTVLTAIYEPDRPYYHSKPLEDMDQPQSNCGSGNNLSLKNALDGQIDMRY